MKNVRKRQRCLIGQENLKHVKETMILQLIFLSVLKLQTRLGFVYGKLYILLHDSMHKNPFAFGDRWNRITPKKTQYLNSVKSYIRILVKIRSLLLVESNISFNFRARTSQRTMFNLQKSDTIRHKYQKYQKRSKQGNMSEIGSLNAYRLTSQGYLIIRLKQGKVI